MENFNWSEFTKSIYIHTDLKSVYDFWTQSEKLEKWFLSKAIFITKENKIIPPLKHIESEYKYKWSWFSQNHFEKGSIIEANNIDYLEFSFAGKCKVQVKLTEVKNQILVELTQTKIPLDDSSKENIRLGCAFGWTFYLLNLKSILEGGIDLRNKDQSRIGMINN